MTVKFRHFGRKMFYAFIFCKTFDTLPKTHQSNLHSHLSLMVAQPWPPPPMVSLVTSCQSRFIYFNLKFSLSVQTNVAKVSDTYVSNNFECALSIYSHLCQVKKLSFLLSQFECSYVFYYHQFITKHLRVILYSSN